MSVIVAYEVLIIDCCAHRKYWIFIEVFSKNYNACVLFKMILTALALKIKYVNWSSSYFCTSKFQS